MLKFIKFGFIGCINTFITVATYALFVYGLEVHYLIANIIGYVLGMVNSYMMNKQWVFQITDRHIKYYIRFITVNLLMLALHSFGLFVLVDTFQLNKLVSQLAIICFVTILNFHLTKTWTFSVNAH